MIDLNITHIAIILVVTAAAAMDLARHRISNWISYSGIVLGFMFGAAYGGWEGLGYAVLGFLVCFAPMLLMYMGGGLGAGDVKLMGAVGSMLAFPEALNALLVSIIVGGFCAFFILLWQGRLLSILTFYVSTLWSLVWAPHEPEPLPAFKDSFPFGVAIALGTYLTLFSLLSDFNSPAAIFG